MVIFIKDQVDHCYTSQDGQKIFDTIFRVLKTKNSVLLDFQGIDAVSSTFVNVALVRLLSYFSFDEIKKTVGFINSNKNINSMIKSRLTFESSKQEDKISA